MKKILLTLLISTGTFANAESSTCIVNSTKNTIPLESTITLQGVVIANPMFSDLEDLKDLTEDQKSVMLMLKPIEPVLLEQWSSTVDSLSCSSQFVTLVLNSTQFALLQRSGAATALGLKSQVTVTGTMRWSESSLEVAGNAVLMNITEVSVEIN